MAERIQVDLVDDIDGSPANHTVTFALDGVVYEIDLNDEHAQSLRVLLNRYIKAARAPKPEPRSTRQQQRDEELARKANKQLTEQIRGAAQRTKAHLSKRAATPDEPPIEETPERAAELDLFATGDQEPKRENSPAPAVSLPQFSSAVD